jgi:hypothetical protein
MKEMDASNSLSLPEDLNLRDVAVEAAADVPGLAVEDRNLEDMAKAKMRLLDVAAEDMNLADVPAEDMTMEAAEDKNIADVPVRDMTLDLLDKNLADVSNENKKIADVEDKNLPDADVAEKNIPEANGGEGFGAKNVGEKKKKENKVYDDLFEEVFAEAKKDLAKARKELAKEKKRLQQRIGNEFERSAELELERTINIGRELCQATCSPVRGLCRAEGDDFKCMETSQLDADEEKADPAGVVEAPKADRVEDGEPLTAGRAGDGEAPSADRAGDGESPSADRSGDDAETEAGRHHTISHTRCQGICRLKGTHCVAAGGGYRCAASRKIPVHRDQKEEVRHHNAEHTACDQKCPPKSGRCVPTRTGLYACRRRLEGTRRGARPLARRIAEEVGEVLGIDLSEDLDLDAFQPFEELEKSIGDLRR